MSTLSRRGFILTAAAALPLAACSNGVGSTADQRIDARVDSAMNFMYSEIPGTRELADNAAGILVMPLVTEAGFGIGGAYGRGALRINGATVDYYSSTSATVGFQIGAQQYAHALFFMTEASLNEFRRSSGWVAGADLEYAISSQGGFVGIDSTTLRTPVIPVVFGQAGLIAGATLEGQRYNRIIP